MTSNTYTRLHCTTLLFHKRGWTKLRAKTYFTSDLASGLQKAEDSSTFESAHKGQLYTDTYIQCTRRHTVLIQCIVCIYIYPTMLGVNKQFVLMAAVLVFCVYLALSHYGVRIFHS